MKTLAADGGVSAERALNTAIINADITRSFEEYLALVDQYYAEDVEVSTETSPEPVVGRDRLKSILFGFLGPFHMIAEIGGLWVTLRGASIPSESRVVSEYHYAHSQEGEALSFDDLWIAAPRDPDMVKPS